MSAPDDELAARARSRIGTTLCGKYRIDRVLGIGGMAAVYGATHSRNGRSVAIKMLHAEVSMRNDVRLRFRQEGRASNSVKHPGAVVVLDDDVAEDGSAFLVMELLEGKAVETIWEQNGQRLPPRMVLAIGHDLCEVLSAAHQAGIVHRDIKPENLFLTTDNRLKVLDFGLARVRDAAAPRLTATGLVFGTPAFMAPEQALGRTSLIDERTDIWAVGATLFTLLSGSMVHEGETAQHLMILSATTQARSLASVLPSADPSIVALVDRALKLERNERWSTIDEMKGSLRQISIKLFGDSVALGEGRDDQTDALPARAASEDGAEDEEAFNEKTEKNTKRHYQALTPPLTTNTTADEERERDTATTTRHRGAVAANAANVANAASKNVSASSVESTIPIAKQIKSPAMANTADVESTLPIPARPAGILPPEEATKTNTDVSSSAPTRPRAKANTNRHAGHTDGKTSAPGPSSDDPSNHTAIMHRSGSNEFAPTIDDKQSATELADLFDETLRKGNSRTLDADNDPLDENVTLDNRKLTDSERALARGKPPGTTRADQDWSADSVLVKTKIHEPSLAAQAAQMMQAAPVVIVTTSSPQAEYAGSTRTSLSFLDRIRANPKDAVIAAAALLFVLVVTTTTIAIVMSHRGGGGSDSSSTPPTLLEPPPPPIATPPTMVTAPESPSNPVKVDVPTPTVATNPVHAVPTTREVAKPPATINVRLSPQPSAK